jgi:hypothetical protein
MRVIQIKNRQIKKPGAQRRASVSGVLINQ